MFQLRLSVAIAPLMLAISAFAAVAQTPVEQESATQHPTAERDLNPDAQESAAESANDEGPGSEVTTQGEADQANAATEAGEAAQERRFVVSTWGGAYGEALQQQVVTPFTSEHGADVEQVTRSDHGELIGDVVEVTAAAAKAGCSSGELIEIDAPALAGGAVPDDFIHGSLQPCAAGSVVWSAVIAMNDEAFSGAKPASLKDVFDTKRFPGARAFIKSPRHLLEMALVADGVSPAAIYQELATDEGVDRALGKLDALGQDLKWYEGPKQALQQLVQGSAVFAQTFNGQAFYAAALGAPVKIVWDGQVYSMNFWAIPASSQAPELGRQFIAHALAPRRLSAVAEEIGYGPTRKSAVALTQEHPRVGIELASYLPTQPDNFANAVAFDETWWTENQARIEARFANWLEAREPPPMPKPVRNPG